MEAICSFSGKYRWLSNFWRSPVVYDDQAYPTVEHAYQASKTVIPKERAFVLGAKTAGIAKRLGRPKDKGGFVTLRSDWCEDFQLKTMHELLRQKFTFDPLRTWLLDTRDAELIEGNTWRDYYWGKVDGEGKNQLGLLLMKVREELRGTG